SSDLSRRAGPGRPARYSTSHAPDGGAGARSHSTTQAAPRVVHAHCPRPATRRDQCAPFDNGLPACATGLRWPRISSAGGRGRRPFTRGPGFTRITSRDGGREVHAIIGLFIFAGLGVALCNLVPYQRAVHRQLDGIHLGHQAILRATVECPRALNAVSTALTFDPSP